MYDGTNFTPFKTEIDELVKGELYLPGAALKDGRYVLNTRSDGAYIISHDGKLIQRFTTANGLPDGTVNYVHVDSRGVLWMMHFNGISSVNLNSSFTVLDSSMGLKTAVFTVYRHNNILYLSTNTGIAYFDEIQILLFKFREFSDKEVIFLSLEIDYTLLRTGWVS